MQFISGNNKRERNNRTELIMSQRTIIYIIEVDVEKKKKKQQALMEFF